MLGLKRGTVELVSHQDEWDNFENDTRTHHIHVVKWNGTAWPSAKRGVWL